MITDFVHSLRKEVKWHGRTENEAAHYCNDCDVEVFCFLFVKVGFGLDFSMYAAFCRLFQYS